MMPSALRLSLVSVVLAGAIGLAMSDPASKPPRPATWASAVAPILDQSCVECHHPGGPGPFSLLTYDDARKRARQIAQVTTSRFMPPWLPEPNCGPFRHERRLPVAQIAFLQQWAAQGAPEGRPADAPPRPHFTDGWQGGPPDQVVTMPRPYTLAGETTSPYRCFVLPLPPTGDKWLRAIEFRPGSRVVRQAVIYADPTGEARRLEQQSGAVGYTAPDGGLGPGAERLAEWAVGAAPWTLPDGAAERLPAGSDLVLLLRFEPDGQPESVRPAVGLDYAALPQSPPATVTLGTRDLILDPGQRATVTDTFTLPVAARVLRVTPHGHPVCRTLRVTATPPTGPINNLLRINDWNADWQDSYQFVTPLILPAGTRLTVRWTADNSRDNPRNPSASPMTVMPGLLFLDDMATVRLQMLSVNAADAAALAQAAAALRAAPIITTTHANRHG